jgi:hypothetical protein
MGKTSERLEAYQTQMSIYAEQHKMILASDVLDMIEQLQDDLKDDTEKVVAELEERSKEYNSGVRLHGKPEEMLTYEAIDIVRKGGVNGT